MSLLHPPTRTQLMLRCEGARSVLDSSPFQEYPCLTECLVVYDPSSNGCVIETYHR